MSSTIFCNFFERDGNFRVLLTVEIKSLRNKIKSEDPNIRKLARNKLRFLKVRILNFIKVLNKNSSAFFYYFKKKLKPGILKNI